MRQKLKLVNHSETTAVETLPDDDLMKLAALDRRDAFEALVTRHQGMVFGLAARFMGNRDLGRDITQDVFLSLWAERQRYRAAGKFKAYLASICLNRCRVVSRSLRNRMKKRAELEQETVASPAPNELPLASLLALERRKEIQGYLTQLPEMCRAVMIFRFTHGLPLAEIAERMDMPLGTVKSHVIRGVRRIRRMMNEG